MLITRFYNYKNFTFNINKRYLNKVIKEEWLLNNVTNSGSIFHEKRLNMSDSLVISYIITVRTTKSNIILNVTDKKGNILIHNTSGKAGFKGNQKNKKFPIVAMLKNIIYGNEFLYGKPAILKFEGFKRYQKFIVGKLKEKFVIKCIVYDNLIPHNGCRPRKMKRK